MRRFLFIFSVLFCSTFSYSQKEKISVISKNMDTLWLINNDIGRLVAKSWEMGNIPSKEKIPVILIVDALPSNINTEKRKYKE
jgi:hypothetical protein